MLFEQKFEAVVLKKASRQEHTCSIKLLWCRIEKQLQKNKSAAEMRQMNIKPSWVTF